jgi:hypothetical protein
MTICPVDTSRAGVVVFDAGNGRHISLSYHAANWKVAVEKIDFGIPEEAGVHEHWGGRAIYRVLLTAKKLPAAASNTFVIR